MRLYGRADLEGRPRARTAEPFGRALCVVGSDFPLDLELFWRRARPGTRGRDLEELSHEVQCAEGVGQAGGGSVV